MVPKLANVSESAEVLDDADACERSCDSAFMIGASYNELGQWLDYF